MFILFARQKTRYQKGQVFPFMIALLAAIIIMAMIVVNLGQLGVFKTDTANAADAAALAGASVLSGTLLGYGLKSDMMAGLALMAAAWMIYSACDIEFPGDFGMIILIYITHLVKCHATYMMALSEGYMAWSNAKKTALQYAYNNVGVDEPKLRFSKSGLSYEEYLKADGYSGRRDLRPGFSEFMEHQLTGYTRGPQTPDGIHISSDWTNPDNWAPPIVTTGYGWTQNEDSSITNSYDSGNHLGYKSYENWVEAQVIGNVAYPLKLLEFNDYFPGGFAATIVAIVFGGSWIKYEAMFADMLPWFLQWLAPILATILAGILSLLVYEMLETMPAGLSFDGGEKVNTDDNILIVKVTRHKRDNDVGLWNFQYGDVSSTAMSRVFRERPEEQGWSDFTTIEPAMLPEKQSGSLGTGGSYGSYSPDADDSTTAQSWDPDVQQNWAQQHQGPDPTGDDNQNNADIRGNSDGNSPQDFNPSGSWFETERHLYETELTFAQ